MSSEKKLLEVQEENIQDSVNSQIESPEEVAKKPNILLWIIVFVLVVTNVLSVAYFIYINQFKSIVINIPEFESKEQKEELIMEETVIVEKDNNVDESIVKKNKNEKIVENKNKLIDFVDLAKNEVLVEWNNDNTAISAKDVFDRDKVERVVQESIQEADPASDREKYSDEFFLKDVDSLMETFSIYNVGKVLNGKYKNKDLFIIKFGFHEMGAKSYQVRAIMNDGGFVVLDNYSSKDLGFYHKVFPLHDELEILNIDTPENIFIKEYDVEIFKVNKNFDSFFLLNDDLEFLFDFDGRRYFKEPYEGCIVTSANDGTVRYYAYNVDFIKNKENNYDSLATPIMLDIVWNNGIKNQADYELTRKTGCGSRRSTCLARASYIKDNSQLKEAGVTLSGDKIFEIKQGSTSTENILQSIYDRTYFEGDKMSYTDFLEDHPIIYWQDPFGDFMEFRNAKYQPMVECGKPVIYLYPEEEMDVQVHVEPNKGFTITEPAYDNGWKVKAKPDGEIYNYADKTVYPYLFWEGYATDYSRPEKGFVIAREDIQDFLVVTLSKLGLNKKEYNEFIDFWLPRMQDKSYYLITFMEQIDFDKMAPLAISPKPDTVIRVFMDYEGLDQKIKIDEPKIVTPQRVGFTVVEWGGALHK